MHEALIVTQQEYIELLKEKIKHLEAELLKQETQNQEKKCKHCPINYTYVPGDDYDVDIIDFMEAIRNKIKEQSYEVIYHK